VLRWRKILITGTELADKTIKLKKFNIYETFVVSLGRIFDEIKDEKLNITDFQNRLNFFADNLKREVSGYEDFFIRMISCIEVPDHFISHSLNTAIFSYILSSHITTGKVNQQNLILAALLHDIGKIDFNEDIKVKYFFRGNDADSIYINHPIWGERIIVSHLKMQGEIARLVLNHHEQIDGTGFPRKLNGSGLTINDNIHITANLLDNALMKTHYDCMDTLSRVINALLQSHGEKFTPAIKSALNEIFIIKKEDRIHHRYIRFAKCKLEDLMTNTTIFCEIYNISSGGIEITPAKELNESSIFKVSSKISSSLALRDKFCKIVWGLAAENKYFYGIRFDTPTDEIILSSLDDLKIGGR